MVAICSRKPPNPRKTKVWHPLSSFEVPIVCSLEGGPKKGGLCKRPVFLARQRVIRRPFPPKPNLDRKNVILEASPTKTPIFPRILEMGLENRRRHREQRQKQTRFNHPFLVFVFIRHVPLAGKGHSKTHISEMMRDNRASQPSWETLQKLVFWGPEHLRPHF